MFIYMPKCLPKLIQNKSSHLAGKPARVLVIALFAIIFFCQSGHAINFVTRTIQASGQNWNGNIWSNTVSGGALVAPTSGNSYEVLSNALIRPPMTASSAGSPLVFPGDSLQFDTGGSIRLKSSAPPAAGYFSFNNTGGQLILNGGELDAGDDMLSVIFSTVNVITNTDTRINGGQDSKTINVTTGTRQGFRNYVFFGGLSGGGNLTFGNACMYNSPQINNPTVIAAIGTNKANFIFNATSSSYGGTINVTSGWLQAGAAGAFGSANIIIAGTSNSYPSTTVGNTPGAMGPAQFNAAVAFSDSGNLTIQNTNSFLLLDTNLSFGGAIIDGFTLTNGTYTAAQINGITGNTNVIDPTGNNNTLTVGAVVVGGVSPSISSQTGSATNFVGDNIQLVVVATGTSPLSYQWQGGSIGSGIYTNLVNGGNIFGVTNTLLTITDAMPSNEGDYIVVITNSAGSITSAVPSSVYIIPLSVTGPTPSSETLYPGGTATFNITALGVQITYQWQKIVGNVTNIINGATNSSLTINNVGPGDEASYNVLVTTPFASTNSQLATLSLAAAPTDAYGQTVMSLGPFAYWRLSEGSGTNAFDYAGGHTAIYGSAAFLQDPGPPYPGFPANNTTLGSLNGSLNSFATLPANNALRLNTNAVTIAAWVNPTTLNPKAGIVFERNQTNGSTDVNGLNLTTNNTLGYAWNNSAASLGWDSGLTLPTSAWSFVVLVVTPTNTTIYMYNTNQQASASFVTANAIASFNGLIEINNDPQDVNGARIFGADTAEVSVFRRALSAAEVVQLYTTGSGEPVGPIISSQPQPQWVFPGNGAQFSVSAAGSAPIYYQWQENGTNLMDGGQVSGVTNTTLAINNVGNGNTGPYSVIVTNSVGSITSSPVMLTVLAPASSFQTNVLQLGPLGYWPLNEASGTSAIDFSGNGYHGTYVAPAALGTTGPNPPYGGFDGADNVAPLFAAATTNSYVSLPSFGVTSSNMSFAAWIYPISKDGTNQAGSTGIIFNRSSTTSGLCYKNDGYQLGYNWNNDPATFGKSSGLIPPTNQWSFVALVVTPTNATIYLYNTNGLATFATTNSHGPSTFTGETRIGSDAQGGRNFNGKIEQAVVFNYSLSASQIAQVYTNGSGTAISIGPTNANLTISPPSGGNVQVSWTAGTLMEATNVTGPWTTNTATSPYTVPIIAPQKFYRVQLQ